MASKDPRIDAYIEASADFAKPVLNHLRKLVHKACPGVQETMKWQFPHFDYKGVFCSMAAFKQHCVFGFWKAALMKDPHKILELKDKTSMGSLGKISSREDLPPDDIILEYLREAIRLNDEGKKLPSRTKSAEKKAFDVPAALTAALDKNRKAREVFDAFSQSHRNEYIEWITEAKTEPTRMKRIDTAIEWMKEGKSRNWKYK